ncbi:MAG: OsmC family protein [Planctomycetes bacterium]|nr:OsmC family protein [Planctomycetota bacterium]
MSLPGEDHGLPRADAMCDGGDLDCGSGLLLIIRNAMQPLPPGGVLEVRSRESSVREDLPAWCRMVGHTLVGSAAVEPRVTRYFIRKRGEDASLGSDLERARDYRWRVRVRWSDGLHAKAFARSHSFAIGQPASFDTADPAPSAIEYLLGALAGCLAVGLAWRMSQRSVAVRNLEVSLEARADNILYFLGVEEGGHPGLAAVEGKLFIDADGSDEEIESLWRETIARSPVAQSLFREIPLHVELRRT